MRLVLERAFSRVSRNKTPPGCPVAGARLAVRYSGATGHAGSSTTNRAPLGSFGSQRTELRDRHDGRQQLGLMAVQGDRKHVSQIGAGRQGRVAAQLAPNVVEAGWRQGKLFHSPDRPEPQGKKDVGRRGVDGDHLAFGVDDDHGIWQRGQSRLECLLGSAVRGGCRARSMTSSRFQRLEKRLASQNLREQREPRLLPEPKIEEHNVESTALDCFESAGGRADSQRPGTIRLEAKTDRLPHAWVIVDNQRGRDSGTPIYTINVEPQRCRTAPVAALGPIIP